MNMPLESIETEALKLAPEDRSRLADRLLASLSQDDVERAWAIEIARREADADADPSSLVTADQAIAEARRAIA